MYESDRIGSSKYTDHGSHRQAKGLAEAHPLGWRAQIRGVPRRLVAGPIVQSPVATVSHGRIHTALISNSQTCNEAGSVSF